MIADVSFGPSLCYSYEAVNCLLDLAACQISKMAYIQPVADLIIFVPRIILFQISLITFSDASNRTESYQFMAVNDCTCPGYNSTYECTVFDSGATLWSGTAMDCPLTNNELVIFPTVTSQRPQTCNNGAITGRLIRAYNDFYISQLTIVINEEINGRIIACGHDSGMHSIEIGSTMLNITTVPFPPPIDVQLVEANHTHLSFNWTQVSLNCPSLQYHIVASNCGECPNATRSSTITCSGNYAQFLSDHPCSFAVQTVVCNGLVGDASIAFNVTITGDLNTSFTVAVEEDIQFQITLILSATIGPIVVLLGITVILGLVFVYLLLRKTSWTKSKTNQWSTYTPETNVVEVELDNTEQRQETIMHNHLEPIEDQNLDSRPTDQIVYAGISPNMAKTVCQQNLISLLHDDCVQYEEIRHETGAPVCEPQAVISDEILVNLDLLLILLKEEIMPRWYEFGLVIGVPKDVMDGYLGYPSDQCLIELLDYWLRHHPGLLTWREVAQALKEIKLHQLAETILQFSTQGTFPVDTDIMSRLCNHPLESNQFPNRECSSAAEVSGSALPHKQWNLGTKCVSFTPEYEDTAGLTCPPPLPPKSRNT